jgi:hypothetical protein
MPIRRYLEKRVVFTSEALSAVGKALAATTETLGIGNDETKRRAVGKFIIRLAQEDDSLDAATLRDRAVAALGGIAYCALPEGVQPLESLPERRVTAERRTFQQDVAGAIEVAGERERL